MIRDLSFQRWSACALAGLFACLALYGCWSMPELVARWGASATGIPLLLGWSVAAAWALGIAVRKPTRLEWVGFALMVLALRIGSLMLTQGRESPSDPHWYGELASHLLAGQGLVLFDPAMHNLARAEFPPAYPVLLAGWGAVFGLAPVAVLAFSTLLDLGAAALIVRLATRLGEARAGLAGAGLYLIWPSTLLSAPLAQKESLVVVLVLALVLGWLAAEKPGRRTALAIGVPAALLALTQPGMAPLGALFGLAQLPRLGWRRMVAIAVPAAAVSVVVMLPWWVRNWTLFHAFVPLTSISGLSLWIGENPEATGNWMPYPPALRGLPELEFARAAGGMAVEWMTHHPFEVVRLNATKFVRSVGVAQFALTRLSAMHPAPGQAVTAALLPLSHVAHILLLGLGAVSLLVRRRPALTALMLAIVAQFLLFGVWFEFSERHRELLTPFLLVSIAAAAAALLRRRTAPAACVSAQPAA